jgi:hypothetical protein
MVFKVLLEPEGAIFGVTMRTYCYLFIFTHEFLGVRKCRTADRVVAAARYNARETLALIGRLYGPAA